MGSAESAFWPIAAGVVVITVLTLRSRVLAYVSTGECSRQVFQRLAS